MNSKEADVVPYALSAVATVSDVWVFAPHPDDEIFGCGGALALHVSNGARVHVVLLTSGAQQGVGEPGSRLAESRQAAGVLGLPVAECWDLPDRGVVYSESLIARMMACLSGC